MRQVLSIVVLLFVVVQGFSQTEKTQPANGTIIAIRQEGIVRLITRSQHQRILIGDLAREENLYVYSKPVMDSSARLLKLSLGQYVNIHEMLTKEVSANQSGQVWLRIVTDDGNEGWIYYSDIDPYRSGNWSIIETLHAGGQIWTVRKLEQWIAVWNTLNVYSYPGFQENTDAVIFHLVPRADNPQLNIRMLAITEEEETVDGIKDHWLKIIDEQGKVGWVFGGHVTVERGGPKYYIPDGVIAFRLGYY